MDCERFDKTSMELLYGELDELSEAAALRHLHHCTRCRDIWGHLRTTREVAEIPQEEPPEDLFESILAAEASAQRSLPVRERFSRGISILAGYAMRPQLAMAALLLLMIGSSLVFVRSGPSDHGHVSVREGGTPFSEPQVGKKTDKRKLVFQGEPAAEKTPDVEDVANHENEKAEVKTDTTRQVYASAMTAYQEGRYAEAERLFSEVASAGAEQAGSAALHEGHAARNGSGCQRAAALYDEVSARYAGRTVSDEAAWHAAACYKALGQLRRASAHYEKLQARPAFAARAKAALNEIAPPAESDDSTANEKALAGSEQPEIDAEAETAKAEAPQKRAASASAPPVKKAATAPDAPQAAPADQP